MTDTETSAAFTFKKRAPKASARKRLATPPKDSDSDTNSDVSDNDTSRQVKRRRKNEGITAISNNTEARSNDDGVHNSTALPAVSQTNADNATKRSNWYEDEHDKSHVKKSIDSPADPLHNTTYKGTANYQSFIQKNPERQINVGPQKLNSNVRSITVTDFAPDVCKDYKQTGFCGFGDSCKFLHAREDYKQGWQLDRDWEVDTKGKKLTGRTVASADRNAKNTEVDENDEKLLESIPFACVICKKSYTNPIVTKCNHYFCEACALKRYRKDPSCAVCAASTGGVFNVAKKLNCLLEKKRERQKQKAEQDLSKDE